MWRGDTMEACLNEWSFNEELEGIRYLRLIVACDIRFSKNQICFEDSFVFPMKCDLQSIGIINYFPQDNVQIKIKQITMEEFD